MSIDIKSISKAEPILNALKEAKQYGDNPTVAIRCIAFNQGKYIEQCLESFINQKTDFPFVVIVHDDASTDNTAEIIKKYADRYPDIIKPVFDTVNRYSEHILGPIMDTIVDAYNPRYIAICEGDDYWIDTGKLQKQVDYMDKHPDCVLCHTDAEILNGNKISATPNDDVPYFSNGNYQSYTIIALTTLIRKSSYDSTGHHYYNHKWLMTDYPRWIELAQTGKFHYLADKTGVYRILPNSASHSTNIDNIIKFRNSTNELEKFYCTLYGFKYVERNKRSLYHKIIKQCYYNKDKDNSRKYWKIAKKEKQTSFTTFLFHFCNVYNSRWIIGLLYKLGNVKNHA